MKSTQRRGENHETNLHILAASLPGIGVFWCRGAESGVEGASTTADTTVDSDIYWDSAVYTTVTIPAGDVYHCAVTCEATFRNPKDAGTDANYYLGLGINDITNPPTGSRRVISFSSENASTDDMEWGPIGTTYLFTDVTGGSTGNSTFFCLAKKHSANDPDGTIENASITASCSENRL